MTAEEFHLALEAWRQRMRDMNRGGQVPVLQDPAAKALADARSTPRGNVGSYAALSMPREPGSDDGEET